MTKDGALSQTQIESKIEGFDVRYVDTSKIQFARAGFYQLIINIPVGGAIKSSYYAVQILDSVYSGEKLVGNYTTGAINSGSSLRLDEYGRIYGVFQGISFNGNAVLSGNTFTASGTDRTRSHNSYGRIRRRRNYKSHGARICNVYGLLYNGIGKGVRNGGLYSQSYNGRRNYRLRRRVCADGAG